MSSTSNSNEKLGRRSFFKYIGAGSVTCALTACNRTYNNEDNLSSFINPFQSPKYPIPLPTDSPNKARQETHFTVEDKLNLPQGFEYKLVASWGDRFGEGPHQIVFGTNNDYTGLLPIAGTSNEFFLFVNHEYLSALTWLQGYNKYRGTLPYSFQVKSTSHKNGGGFFIRMGELEFPSTAIDVDLESRGKLSPQQQDRLDDFSQRILDDLGISILHVKRNEDGHFEVFQDSIQHKRIAGHKAYNINGEEPFQFTGPAKDLFKNLPRGTFGGCSGGTTTWGTFLSCEENYQDVVQQFIDPSGQPLKEKLTFQAWFSNHDGDQPNNKLGLPYMIVGQGSALKEPLDGRHYGWVCEVHPQTGHMRKHTALGRFRHENVALRCENSKHIAVYMGDDRRGGHTWKFVSKNIVTDRHHPETSKLLESGTLFAAQFKPGFEGCWLPLDPQTKLVKPDPTSASTGHMMLPYLPHGGQIAVGVGKYAKETPEGWVASVESFTGKPFEQCTLGDLIKVPDHVSPDNKTDFQKAVILTDAFAYANAIGATPTARPEDLEVHPEDNSVYIAYTDFTGGSDGGPDPSIFQFATSQSSQRYGGIYRITEHNDDPTSTEFHWGMFVNSGEIYENGGGFACPDNLDFDSKGNLWFCTDITTSAQNHPVNREKQSRTQPGDKRFMGIFGNNALFVVPSSGPNAGAPVLFATGPIESELTGPTFTEDGRTLILSVQHPGERSGTRSQNDSKVQNSYLVASKDGELFQQTRDVPVGSNWPSSDLDTVPKPAVVSIIRKRITS